MRYTYLTILLPTSHCLSKTNFLKETKNRIHMNPYISAKRRWPGDFFNFGCHITSPLVISGEAMTNFNSRHVFVERYH